MDSFYNKKGEREKALVRNLRKKKLKKGPDVE
jgi:hypothetical protein